MRELETSDAPGAALAVEYFVYRIALNARMLAATLNGLAAFIFTVRTRSRFAPDSGEAGVVWRKF